MKIIVDAMGGDNAPLAPVQGALEAHRACGVDILLVGRAAEVLRALEQCGEKTLPAGVEIRDASEVVEIADDPATAFKMKKDSSLTVGLNLLKEGAGDAFVSAGSTGALLAGATLLVKRIKGIRRAALAPVVPTGNGGAVLIDCGANAECPPEYLLQFAYMGSYYAEHVLGRPEPKVGLLNIGAEPSKGTTLQTTVYPMLQEAAKAGRINFVGNVEAREAVEGSVDVIVSDGYSGNIFLKTMEGTGLFLAREIKKMFMKSLLTKLAAVMVSGGLKQFKKMMDSSEVGGTALLAEIPEMFGAEAVLFRRCADGDTARSLPALVEECKDYFVRHGQVIYENPSPGNKAGGITTLEEKSLGCVQKGGSSPVRDVLHYGERAKKRGLCILQTPGNDLVSTTGLAAAGAQLILFTTGRGTPFGAPVPTVKISTNTALAGHKAGWIDYSAGGLAQGEGWDKHTEALLRKVLDTASGAPTRSEQAGYRDLAIWKDGVTL